MLSSFHSKGFCEFIKPCHYFLSLRVNVLPILLFILASGCCLNRVGILFRGPSLAIGYVFSVKKISPNRFWSVTNLNVDQSISQEVQKLSLLLLLTKSDGLTIRHDHEEIKHSEIRRIIHHQLSNSRLLLNFFQWINLTELNPTWEPNPGPSSRTCNHETNGAVVCNYQEKYIISAQKKVHLQHCYSEVIQKQCDLSLTKI